jgi:hypothetical protein
MRNLNIPLERNFPPVPVRSCDWSAWVNDQEETTTCTGTIPADTLTSLAERFDESTHDRKEQTHD